MAVNQFETDFIAAEADASQDGKTFRTALVKPLLNAFKDTNPGGGHDVVKGIVLAALEESNPQVEKATADAVAAQFSAGGSPAVYNQQINTGYTSVLGALYDSQQFSGKFANGTIWVRDGKPVTVQETVFDKILAAIKPPV